MTSSNLEHMFRWQLCSVAYNRFSFRLGMKSCKQKGRGSGSTLRKELVFLILYKINWPFPSKAVIVICIHLCPYYKPCFEETIVLKQHTSRARATPQASQGTDRARSNTAWHRAARLPVTGNCQCRSSTGTVCTEVGDQRAIPRA